MQQRLTAQTAGHGIHGDDALLRALLSGYPDPGRDRALYDELTHAAESGGPIGITYPLYFLIRYIGGPADRVLDHLAADLSKLATLGYSFLGDDLTAAVALRIRRDRAIRDAIVAYAIDPSTPPTTAAMVSRIVAQVPPTPGSLATRLRTILQEDQAKPAGDSLFDPIQSADQTLDTLLLGLIA